MSNPRFLSVEDDAFDVIQKSLSGLQTDAHPIEPTLGSRIAALQQAAKHQIWDESSWMELASELGLHGPSLLALAKEPQVPTVPLPDGWMQWTLPFGPYSVNSFCIPVAPKQCVLIDAGFNSTDFMEQIEACPYHPIALLITHHHRDHVGAHSALISRFPHLRIFAMDPVLCRNTAALREGDSLTIEALQIRALHTPGHADDALSFQLRHGLQAVHAIAGGDTIYARSAGKIHSHYRASLRSLSDKILSLDPDTLLLPGHGPVTTIGDERQHNPFFAS